MAEAVKPSPSVPEGDSIKQETMQALRELKREIGRTPPADGDEKGKADHKQRIEGARLKVQSAFSKFDKLDEETKKLLQPLADHMKNFNSEGLDELIERNDDSVKELQTLLEQVLPAEAGSRLNVSMTSGLDRIITDSVYGNPKQKNKKPFLRDLALKMGEGDSEKERLLTGTEKIRSFIFKFLSYFMESRVGYNTFSAEMRWRGAMKEAVAAEGVMKNKTLTPTERRAMERSIAFYSMTKDEQKEGNVMDDFRKDQRTLQTIRDEWEKNYTIWANNKKGVKAGIFGFLEQPPSIGETVTATASASTELPKTDLFGVKGWEREKDYAIPDGGVVLNDYGEKKRKVELSKNAVIIDGKTYQPKFQQDDGTNANCTITTLNAGKNVSNPADATVKLEFTNKTPLVIKLNEVVSVADKIDKDNPMLVIEKTWKLEKKEK